MSAALWPLTPRGTRRILCSQDNGLPLLVIRPEHPEVALAVAQVCVIQQDNMLFEVLPAHVGLDTYTVRGWMGPTDIAKKRGTIIDRDGRFLEAIVPGDSFVTVERPEILRVGGTLGAEKSS